jgi:hypothetical protein
MRNALILTGVWIGILITAYAIVFWDQGIDRPLPISVLEQAAEATTSEYVQPDGLFSLSIPMGWKIVEDADYVRIEDPNDAISVWVVAVEAPEIELAIEEALDATGAGMLSMTSTEPLPAGAWNGEEIAVTYEGEDEQLLVRLQRPDTWTVVMFAQGATKALQALSENLDWIWSRLAIPANELMLL